MDAHELAIAALSQVSQNSSHPRDSDPPGNVASSRSSPNDATASTSTATRVEPSATNNAMERCLPTNQTYSDMAPHHQNDAENEEGQLQPANGEPLQSTSSANSQDTTDGNDTISTPPTSEGFSSQSTNADGLSQLSQLSQLAAAQQPLTNTFATRPNVVIPAAGHKRTADGLFKSPSSPKVPHDRGHARTTSTISNASTSTSRSVAELASEMRTRFSYAMVKVNNGWTTNSIDEVESLASQAGSPTSSNSTLHGRRSLITSPRTAIANVQGRSNNITAHTNQLSHSLPNDFDLFPSNQQPTRTYESFWQDHSTRTPHHRHYSHAQATSPPQKHSLAPPADIRPTPRSRRSDPKYSKPPTIPGQSRSDLSQSSHHSFNNTPRTPQRDFNHDGAIQTPTQKTLQEQDAIETLLFMSSPGNSANMGPAFPPPRTQASPPQTSPLKYEFGSQIRGAQGRRVEFEKMGNSTGTEAGGYNSGRNKMKRSTEDIDKLLDEMGDSSSEDELVVRKNYTSPRPRVSAAAGRF